MVALSHEDAVTLLVRRKPGPLGRDDAHRPVVCPERHIGANIRFDRMGGTDPQYARANYRCVTVGPGSLGPRSTRRKRRETSRRVGP